MDFLTKLLAVEVPENTKLQSAELGFRGLFPWWLAALIVLALGAGFFYLYLQERTKIGIVRRVIMALLRTAAIAVLLLLLFRPVLLAEFVGQRPRHIVLLIDNSLSMQQQDRRLSEADRLRVAIAKGLVQPGTSIGDAKSLANIPEETPKDPARAHLVRAVFHNSNLNLLAGIQKHGPVQPFLFGKGLHGAIDDAAVKDKSNPVDRLLASFKANESETALADAVLEILQRKDGSLPAAIVVATDGQDNASKFSLQEAAKECARWQVPLHIYGVGSTEAGSLQLKNVGIPETIFHNDTITVPLHWRAQGFKKGTVEISLTLGGKVVAKKELPVELGEDLRDVLTFTPDKGTGKEQDLDLKASIRLIGNDVFQDDITKPVRLIDSRIKVLVVEGSPRFEYKFLQPALIRDRRVDASFLLVNADPKVLNSGPPFIPAFPATRDKFFEAKYNLIVLGDVPAAYFGKEHLEWIRDFVKNRGGLIVMAGRQHMPASYENTPLAEVLPVEFKEVKFPANSQVRSQEYHPELTEAGKRTDMLALADVPEESLKIWQTLPGFFWNYPVVKLRPGATSLIVNPRAKLDQADKQPMPIAASHYYGKGQVLYLGTDETWRWRFNVQDKHFVRFWGQVIYQMGLPHLLGDHAKRVQVALERSQAFLDKPGLIFVRLWDKDYNPRKDEQVEAVLEWIDAPPGQERIRPIKLQAIPGREGEYRALLPHDKQGRFEVKIHNPETTTFNFRVDLPPRHELAETGLAEESLRESARVSGGGFYREEDLHTMAAGIQPQFASFTRHQEIVLWNPLALVIFVLLLSAEWLMRKFANLT
jgi:hypothetical protein